MKKLLKLLYQFPLYVLYVLFTLEERNKYLASERTGYKCIDAKNDMFGTTYTYDRNQKPERNYLTWREFWAARGYYK